MRKSYLFKIAAVIIIQALLFPGISFGKTSTSSGTGKLSYLSPALHINEASVKNTIIAFTSRPDLAPLKLVAKGALANILPHFTSSPKEQSLQAQKKGVLILPKTTIIPFPEQKRITPQKLEVTKQHHGILSLLREGDNIILFDYDPDNHVEEKERDKNYFPLESTWVIFAKRKGCKVWWVRPAWSKAKLGTRINISDFEGVLTESKLNKLPRITGRLVLTFCMDFFDNRRIPWVGANAGMFAREQNNATREDIQKQILNITAILKEKLDKKELASIDVLHLAESIRYAPADHAEYVKELLTESFVEPPREENQEKGPKMKQFPPAADRKVFVLGQQNNLSPFIERAI